MPSVQSIGQCNVISGVCWPSEGFYCLSSLCCVCVCDRDRGGFFDKRSRGLLQYERPYLLAVEDPKDGENDLGRNSWNASRVRQVWTRRNALVGDLITLNPCGSV